MRLLNRDLKLVIVAPLEARHYAALIRFFFTFTNPISALTRYLTGQGDYPWTVAVRTPLGLQWITMYSAHDLLTVVEIFCRRDYGETGGRIVVDCGTNIGISALFFLTRRSDAYLYGFEPDPRNLAKAAFNLSGMDGRYRLLPVAIADKSGRARFLQETTGRYGGLAAFSTRAPINFIEVECLGITEALDE